MALAIYPAYSRKQRLDAEVLGEGGVPLTVMVTSTAASPNLTAMGDMTGLAVGATVLTPAGAAGKKIVAMDNAAHTATLDGNSGVTATENWTFQNPPNSGPLSPLNGANVRLYKSTFNPAPNSTLADFVANEVAYTGYVAQLLAMVADAIDGNGNYLGESQLLIWQPTGTAATDTVGGLWADDGTGVLVAWPLDAPVALTGPTTVLKVVVFESYMPPGYEVQVLP